MQNATGIETKARTWLSIVKLKEAKLATRRKNWKKAEIKFNAKGKPESISKKNIKKARKAVEKLEAAAKAQKSVKNEKIKYVKIELGMLSIMMVEDRD